jgi:outer membrane protein insertion porin family
VLTAPVLAQSGTIEEIRVEGNQRVEPETVRSYMTVGPGDSFDAAAIDRSLKSLFATGLFADVTIRREGDALVVRVVENPIINQLAFEGNQRVKDEELEAEVQLRPRVVYTRSKVQADVARILEIYRRNGRFAATVEPKVIQQPQNRVDLVFEINEGSPTRVRRISFVGNKAFSDGELRGEIQTKETAWYRFLTTDDTYDPDRLSFDRELLRRFYLSEGYADVAILSATADLTPDRKDFYITFTISEGEPYTFGRVRVKSALEDLPSTELHQYVTTFPGETYDALKVEETIQDMVEALGDRGYAFVEVDPVTERDAERRVIDLTYDIAEGPRVYVERIDIEGNVRTLDRVIRRQFRLAEGDAFSSAKLRRSEQRIRNLDFFETVTVRTEEGSAPDQAVINVEVAEKSTGELTFGAGFSTFDGFLGSVVLRERNLLGKAQDLQLSLTLSTRRTAIDLSFTEPAFLGKDDVAAGFDLFNKSTDFQDESSFDRDELGFGLRLSYPLAEDFTHAVRYALRRDKITDVDKDASLLIREQEGSAVTSLVGQTFTYDRLDSTVNPTDGYLIKVSQDLAGLGGDVDYVRLSASTAAYHEFEQNWVGSLSVSEGYIVPLFEEDTRIVDRYFLGGSQLRGFASGGVGPRDRVTDDALGGNAFWTASAELTFPLGLPEELGLLGRVFSDVGAAWDTESIAGVDVQDSANPRAAVGVGLTYVSPLGPLKMDFAFAVLKEDFDETEFFGFSFGTRF